MGKIITAIEDNGLSENTLIIFASDHGDGVAAHQWNQKTVLYENSVKVPFIIVPPKGADGLVTDIPVNASTDLLPTVLDFANIKSNIQFDGISLKPIVDAPEKHMISGKGRYIFTETNFKTIKGEKTDGYMVRKGDYKYVVYELENGFKQEQLFNLKEDPGEMVNLAVVALHADTLQAFRLLMVEAKNKYVKLSN